VKYGICACILKEVQAQFFRCDKFDKQNAER